MTGEEIYQKLKGMTQKERKKEIIIEDFCGVTASFITLENKLNLEEGRIDKDNDPEGILEKNYIGIHASGSYFLG